MNNENKYNKDDFSKLDFIGAASIYKYQMCRRMCIGVNHHDIFDKDIWPLVQSDPVLARITVRELVEGYLTDDGQFFARDEILAPDGKRPSTSSNLLTSKINLPKCQKYADEFNREQIALERIHLRKQSDEREM